MKKNIVSIVLLVFVFSSSLCAQVAMGKWRTHFAYNNVSQIAQSETKIYAVSEGALYSVDKSDGGLEFYSKISGLNGANISRIEFDSQNQQLLIVYTNGNIDILGSGGIINVPDLYKKQMSASKEINQIMFYQNKAYLACDFGIIVLNMQKKEIADTYYIGPNASEVQVLSTTIHNDSIYALTPNTLFKASINEKFLINYEFWSTSNELPGSGTFQAIGSFAGKLFLLRGAKLYMRDSNGWTPFIPDISVGYFNISNNKMLINDGGSSILIADDLLNIKTIKVIGKVSDTEFDATNSTYWLAANALGIISYKQISDETHEINYFKPEGPAMNNPFDMIFAGKKLFVVPGGRWGAQDNREGVVMMYKDGSWTNILGRTIQEKTGKRVLDFMNVAVDPTDDKHFFVTSYGTGLYEFRENKFDSLHNESNSSIKSIFPGDPLYMRLDGAVYDKQNNLFLTNTSVAAGIKVLLSNGEWRELNYPGVSNKPTLGKILISNQNPNQKWVSSVRSTPGICIFDDNGSIADQSDDKSTFYYPFVYPETDNNGQTIPVSTSPGAVYTLAQDKNGVIWAGTDQGPFLFQNLSKIYEADYTCSRVKIPRDDGSGNADYLLKDERIKAIAIDGANRKWIGTESSGVYLMSENGQVTIQHFTVSNSPLLSNDILSIAINPVSGEVFFGTGQGIVSYQSDAAAANDTFGEVYAYPNPVREGYNGVITITGLVADTQVKITDLTGNLVCQTVSNGSLATWDGKDIHGRKVSTGIYLAICVSPDGTQSTITKIMVIN
ncbi:MAG: T9SS type A sorting domain-containing protein [Paludibacter sp.]|nr:T9SS type A sorting domain-containing protein [Paludibacter sp.]